MLRVSIITLCVLFLLPADAAVYRYVDENGDIIFTDKPILGAEQIPLKMPPSVSLPKPTPQPTIANTDKGTETEEKAKTYRLFKIIQPSADETLWSNTGSVTVTFSMTPPLQTQHGHYIQLALDGKRLNQQWQSNSLSLTDIARGTHQIRAYLYDRKGIRLRASQQVTFYLKRASKLNNKAP